MQRVGLSLQVIDLRKKIEDEQRMLMQWSEERLALAQSLLGLLELHVSQANKDIIAFDGELQVGLHASYLDFIQLSCANTNLPCTWIAPNGSTGYC